MIAQRCVVTLKRHIDEARNKALERVTPNEQRDALSFLKVEDRDDRFEQLVCIGLEQLIAWEVVQDVQEGLAVMGRRCQPGPLNDLPDLEPEQRDRVRIPT